MIVAGDIGGTKTHLALFDWKTDRVDPVRLESFHSADYTSLEDMLTEFLVPPKPPTSIDEFATEKTDDAEPEPERSAEKSPKIDAACFGIAGPVIQNRCQTTNLPWVVDGAKLAKQFDIPRVKLLNDLEAMAHGILLLRPDEIETLNAGNPPPHKQALALIAAAGLKGQADIAKQALDLFASIYGAEAGNLALKAMTLNGVYLGGGIAPKLLAKLKDGTFMKAFTNKGRYTRLMSSIPVKVVMNQQTALLGAASVAAALSHTPAS